MATKGTNRIISKLLPPEKRGMLLLTEYCKRNGLDPSHAKRGKNPVEGEVCELIVRRPNGQEEVIGTAELFPKKEAN